MGIFLITEGNNDHSEYDISGEKELRDLLYSLIKQEPRVVLLEIPGICIFTLGVGLPHGFIQFSKTGEPPYLVASTNRIAEGTDTDDEVEFDAGGTPTSIPKRLCLPYDQIVDVIIYLFKSHELPRFVKWEEV